MLGRSNLLHRVLAIATGLVMLYLLLLTGQRALEAHRVRREVEAAREEIGALRARNLALQAELSSGRLDEETERIAREELSLVKPGDRAVILIWPEGTGRGPEGSPQRQPDPEPNWRSWLRLWFDVDPPVR